MRMKKNPIHIFFLFQYSAVHKGNHMHATPVGGDTNPITEMLNTTEEHTQFLLQQKWLKTQQNMNLFTVIDTWIH